MSEESKAPKLSLTCPQCKQPWEQHTGIRNRCPVPAEPAITPCSACANIVDFCCGPKHCKCSCHAAKPVLKEGWLERQGENSKLTMGKLAEVFPAETAEYTCPRCGSNVSTHICMAEPVAGETKRIQHAESSLRKKAHERYTQLERDFGMDISTTKTIVPEFCPHGVRHNSGMACGNCEAPLVVPVEHAHDPLMELDGHSINGLKRCKNCGLSCTYWEQFPACIPSVVAGEVKQCSCCGAFNPEYTHPCGESYCWHCEDNRGRHDDCEQCGAPSVAVPEGEANNEKWRVGRKLGRTLYIGDRFIGSVDTPELASQIVEAVNAGGVSKAGMTAGAKYELLEWAVSRWKLEVENRPLTNVHRRTLDDTWRQVIRYAGGRVD